MKKTFIKNPAYIGGIITLLSIITISLLFAVMLIGEYDYFICLFIILVLLIVYLPAISALLYLFAKKINFDDEGVYTTLFNKNKKRIIEYKNIKKIDIYASRGLIIEITLNCNEIIELEYRKEIVILLKDKCNEQIKDYITKFLCDNK